MLPNVLVELLGRSSGPFHARLFMQPIVAVALAIRAGLRDAHSANPAFLWGIVTGSTADRRQLIGSAWQDLGKMFVVGVAIDLVYTLLVLHAVRPIQTLIVVVALAVVPYTVVRGLANRVMRRSGHAQPRTAH